jgi:hypothetical protein
VTFVLVAGLSIALLVTAYRLAINIGENPAWAVAAVMCIPCINILMLLHLTSRATVWCRNTYIPEGQGRVLRSRGWRRCEDVSSGLGLHG